MPAMATRVIRDGAQFYWHLGDFRMIENVDEDYAAEPEHRDQKNELMLLSDYERNVWQDFVDAQIAPFGAMRVFLGIGNHDVVRPKSRAKFLSFFSRWLDQPQLREQRLADDPADETPHTYYHWIRDGIDFVYLDNATTDEFDAEQLRWLSGVLSRDADNPAIGTLVVAMHEALPGSLADRHSMSASRHGRKSGRQVYTELLRLQSARKRVYVLASHSHFFVSGIFNTPYWRAHGGVLPGWIVGTAGAYRYRLPGDFKQAEEAKTNVYGYLLATVDPDGSIGFQFRQIAETDISAPIVERYGQQLVHGCFLGNHQ